jgi:hypothetical protein
MIAIGGDAKPPDSLVGCSIPEFELHANSASVK